MTEKLFEVIDQNTGIRNNLKELNLYKSANFDSNEAVSHLIELLSSENNLKTLFIDNQRGTRKVRVDMEYANEL